MKDKRARRAERQNVQSEGKAPRKRAPASPEQGARFADVREAALTLFARLGYHGTSMKDIATVLRMRAPSLYNHVTSKQVLLREIILATHENADRELRAALASSSDVVEQLRRTTEVHVRFHMRQPREWRVASRELVHLEEPTRTRVRRIRRNFEELVIGLIERGVREGRFDASSPKLTAYAIFRLGSGVGQWYRPGGEFSDSEIAFYYGDLALRMAGVKSRATATKSTRTDLRDARTTDARTSSEPLVTRKRVRPRKASERQVAQHPTRALKT